MCSFFPWQRLDFAHVQADPITDSKSIAAATVAARRWRQHITVLVIFYAAWRIVVPVICSFSQTDIIFRQLIFHVKVAKHGETFFLRHVVLWIKVFAVVFWAEVLLVVLLVKVFLVEVFMAGVFTVVLLFEVFTTWS